MKISRRTLLKAIPPLALAGLGASRFSSSGGFSFGVTDALAGGNGMNLFTGLKIQNNPTNPNTKVNIVCAEVFLIKSSGAAIYRTGISLTCDIAAGGANGLDNGLKQASTWYHIWLAGRESDNSVVSLFSVSPTAPSLPSGYTHKAYVGAIYNKSSNIFHGIRQADRFVTIDYTQFQNLPLGTHGPFVPVDVSTAIPTTARRVYGDVYISHTASGVTQQVFALSDVDDADPDRFGWAVQGAFDVSGGYQWVFVLNIWDAQTIYYYLWRISGSGSSTGSIDISAWEF